MILFPHFGVCDYLLLNVLKIDLFYSFRKQFFKTFAIIIVCYMYFFVEIFRRIFHKITISLI